MTIRDCDSLNQLEKCSKGMKEKETKYSQIRWAQIPDKFPIIIHD